MIVEVLLEPRCSIRAYNIAIFFDKHILILDDRFVCTPIPDVQQRLKDEGEALTKEMSNLDKKEDYLEKTYTNSKNSLEQVLKGAS